MARLAELLTWQWRAYWRRLLRGGTAARSNLFVLGLIAVAGFARYLTFLRDVAAAAAKGNTGLLDLTLAALLLLCLQPGWDAARLALAPREMVRFPLTAVTRLGLRLLSRFVAPASWIMTAACAAVVWPLSQLSHPVPAFASCFLLLVAAFLTGAALADFGSTAKGSRMLQAFWVILAASVAIAWIAGARALPPLPSRIVLLAGMGSGFAVPASMLFAAMGVAFSLRALPWMLAHAPRGESTRQTRSARKMTLFRRELRLNTRLIEIRSVWAISAALCFYLATAAKPEPDALRVMLGVLGFLAISVAMNSFGQDGVPGLDRFLLWPVTGMRIVLAKNLALAVLLGAPMVPLAILAGWRFGWREGTGNLLEAAALVLGMLSWGNITSVRHPESSASGGYILDQVAAMAAVAIPTAAAIGALRGTGKIAALVPLGLVGLCALAHALSLRWSVRYFATQHERMRQGLT